MYMITNRKLKKDQGGFDIFTSKPSEEGPNELRLIKISKSSKDTKFEVLADELPTAKVKSLKNKFNLDIDELKPWYSSLEVACQVFENARKNKKHILLYVHGYNNDMKDVVETSLSLEKHYKDTIVIPFSWPAKGGGPISGTANYLDDKRDARVSSGALDRVIQKLQFYHELLTASSRRRLWKLAESKHGDNLMEVREDFVKRLSKECKVSLNLLCHSMGNYVLKHTTIPTQSRMRKLTFDNIALLAADTNNALHKTWVDTIPTKGSTYIIINEDDFALAWARRKPGEEQLARLGHYTKELDSNNALYIDVTDAKSVQNKHNYFVGEAVENNSKLLAIFNDIFCGRGAERRVSRLKYHSDANVYRIP